MYAVLVASVSPVFMYSPKRTRTGRSPKRWYKTSLISWMVDSFPMSLIRTTGRNVFRSFTAKPVTFSVARRSSRAASGAAHFTSSAPDGNATVFVTWKRRGSTVDVPRSMASTGLSAVGTNRTEVSGRGGTAMEGPLCTRPLT